MTRQPDPPEPGDDPPPTPGPDVDDGPEPGPRVHVFERRLRALVDGEIIQVLPLPATDAGDVFTIWTSRPLYGFSCRAADWPESLVPEVGGTFRVEEFRRITYTPPKGATP